MLQRCKGRWRQHNKRSRQLPSNSSSNSSNSSSTLLEGDNHKSLCSKQGLRAARRHTQLSLQQMPLPRGNLQHQRMTLLLAQMLSRRPNACVLQQRPLWRKQHLPQQLHLRLRSMLQPQHHKWLLQHRTSKHALLPLTAAHSSPPRPMRKSSCSHSHSRSNTQHQGCLLTARLL